MMMTKYWFIRLELASKELKVNNEKLQISMIFAMNTKIINYKIIHINKYYIDIT